jgi:hypothetical protein
MKRLLTLAAASLSFAGSFALPGCTSNQPASQEQNQAYGGGNGAFGEDPAQPGEYSANRFRAAAGEVPSTQPAASDYR